MSLIAFSVRKTSLVNPRYLWAALNVTREKRVRMTGVQDNEKCALTGTLKTYLVRYAQLLWDTFSSTV